MEHKLHLLLGILQDQITYMQILTFTTLLGIIYYLKLEVSQMNDILLNYKNIV